MKLIYLASPYVYRRDDVSDMAKAQVQEFRYQLAIDASAWLMNLGYSVISPIVATHPVAVKHDLPKGSEYWMKFDEILLNKCDEMMILMIDGVFDSPGVKREFKINRENGKDTRLLIPLNGPEIGGYRILEMDWDTRDCLEL